MKKGKLVDKGRHAACISGIFKILTAVLCFVFISNCILDYDPPKRMDLDSFEIFPGDELNYLQWHFAKEFGKKISYIDIYRIGNEDRNPIGHYSLHFSNSSSFPNWGTFLDTTCINGIEYMYFLKAEELWDVYFSDTISAIPQQGLPYPVPPSPESLNVENDDSTFTLQWISPQNNDSLYYIYRRASTGLRRWYTDSIEPIQLNIPEYALPYSIEKYFKIAVFVNGVLSLPSDSVEIIQ